ncbi:hypothetical protein F1721_32870 [Saccharopolyspora hirsuta]|uniref:Uncharacterized protein n=1 Tax=Saccharopolyspora hirsuta TaxID=1837 RepID=A0A5M7B7S6_SACHI|nr:hypothetical protein [Saccharopolyspora hirsuta]KAA5825432.1 hypothetical protein F1721_32870 [Saccharopolyspora hirsuta]
MSSSETESFYDADGRLWEWDADAGVWFPPEYSDLELETKAKVEAEYGPLTPAVEVETVDGA